MKISKLFHWLYFIVMMLPIFTIPIFAIYSHRHDLTERTTVDITYKYQSNEVNNIDDVVYDNIYYMEYLYFYSDIEGDYTFELDILDCTIDDYDGFSLDEYFLHSYNYKLSNFKLNVSHSFTDYHYVFMTFTLEVTEDDNYIYFDLGDGLSISDVVFSVHDINEFKSYYNDNYSALGLSLPQYTDFNVIESVDVQDTNSDIMSVFINDTYNVVNKYFNYDRVFNFADLYTWLNTTFFNGQAPLGFFIFWHLLIYWLLTSILWLIFDVLMYVPQLVHRWLDKASLS